MNDHPPSQNELSGMTVNERLAALKLFPRFDQAVRSKRMEMIVAVLVEAKLSADESGRIALAILENPQRYGFK